MQILRLPADNYSDVNIYNSVGYLFESSALSALSINIPAAVTPGFNAFITFKSPNAATVFSANNCYFVGSGCANGVFTPIKNSTYRIDFEYSPGDCLGVVKSNFEFDFTDEQTAQIHTIAQNLITETHPVGSIEINVSGTNPSEYIGGVWAPWGSGRLPIGVDPNDADFNAPEKTGGEKIHTLTVDELPIIKPEIKLNLQTVARGAELAGVSSSSSTSQDNVIKPFGEGQAHNNMPPYITCYMWQRIK
jgi:hypothetical protein